MGPNHLSSIPGQTILRSDPFKIPMFEKKGGESTQHFYMKNPANRTVFHALLWANR